MRTVNLREARAMLSALVEATAKGETVVIANRGQPRAVLVGLDEWIPLARSRRSVAFSPLRNSTKAI